MVRAARPAGSPLYRSASSRLAPIQLTIGAPASWIRSPCGLTWSTVRASQLTASRSTWKRTCCFNGTSSAIERPVAFVIARSACERTLVVNA